MKQLGTTATYFGPLILYWEGTFQSILLYIFANEVKCLDKTINKAGGLFLHFRFILIFSAIDILACIGDRVGRIHIINEVIK